MENNGIGITYTLSGDLTPSTKEKLTIGIQEFDQLEIGYVPQNIVEHGTARGEISLSWELPDEAFDPKLGNRPVPETASFDADGLDAPDEISVRLQLDYQKPAIELSRTDMGRVALEAVLDQPGARTIQAANALLGGDVKQASAGVGEGLTVTATHEDVDRYGINQQHELGFEVADVFEGKLSLLAELGRNDIRNRRTVTLGPDAEAPVEPEPAPKEPEPGKSDQRVITPEDGVSIYGAPGREDL